jgi:hypothetical protein
MIRTSVRFELLLLGHIPPNWFLVRPEQRAELERLLAELGFATGGRYRLMEQSAEGLLESAAPKRRGGRRKRT